MNRLHLSISDALLLDALIEYRVFRTATMLQAVSGIYI